MIIFFSETPLRSYLYSRAARR